MRKNLSDFLRDRFGAGASPVLNRSLSIVGTAAAQLWAQAPQRVAALLVNLSPNTLYAGFGADVAATKGIRVNPNGGTLLLIWDQDFDLTGWEMFVVADAAASNLLTVEWLTTDVPAGS